MDPWWMKECEIWRYHPKSDCTVENRQLSKTDDDTRRPKTDTNIWYRMVQYNNDHECPKSGWCRSKNGREFTKSDGSVQKRTLESEMDTRVWIERYRRKRIQELEIRHFRPKKDKSDLNRMLSFRNGLRSPESESRIGVQLPSKNGHKSPKLNGAVRKRIQVSEIGRFRPQADTNDLNRMLSSENGHKLYEWKLYQRVNVLAVD